MVKVLTRSTRVSVLGVSEVRASLVSAAAAAAADGDARETLREDGTLLSHKPLADRSLKPFSLCRRTSLSR